MERQKRKTEKLKSPCRTIKRKERQPPNYNIAKSDSMSERYSQKGKKFKNLLTPEHVYHK